MRFSVSHPIYLSRCHVLHVTQARAADAIFQLNNATRGDGAVDLHGLYVAEAESIADR